ncbi:phosphotransferase [Actinomycetaceae bacterium TAE3-ERU4]|nr:phosphotransferase [Actinomycetaceae bacterium TAE3-ERU4]
MSKKLSNLKLASLAVMALPDQRIVALRPPQYETDELIVTGVEVDDGRTLVVCSPKSPAAGADLEAQYHLLNLLGTWRDNGQISFDVPRPVAITRSRKTGGALIHTKVPGTTMDEEDFTRKHLAISVGRAISSLHSMKTGELATLEVPYISPKGSWMHYRATVRAARKTNRVPQNLIRRWSNELLRKELWDFSPVPVHGSLAADSFIIAGDTVMAIKDLARVHCGDPAQDIAWFLAAANEEFFDELFNAYTRARKITDSAPLLDRAQFITELNLAIWLLESIKQGNEEDAQEAEEMLRDLASELGDSINFTPPQESEAEVVIMPDRDFWNAETSVISESELASADSDSAKEDTE